MQVRFDGDAEGTLRTIQGYAAVGVGDVILMLPRAGPRSTPNWPSTCCPGSESWAEKESGARPEPGARGNYPSIWTTFVA